jgi:hypothetical protein
MHEGEHVGGDDPAIPRMGGDELALPFRIEEVLPVRGASAAERLLVL